MAFYYLHKSSKESQLLDFSNSITEGLVLAAIFDGNKRGVDLFTGTENLNASKRIVDNTMLLTPAYSVLQPNFSMPSGDKTLIIRYKTKNDASTSWPFGAPNNPRVILAEYLGNYQVYDGAWQNSGVPVEHDVYHTFIVVYKSGVGYLYKDGVLIHTWNRDTAISQIVYSAGTTRKTINVEFFYAYSRALDAFEIHSITNNPCQILKPRRKWFYFSDSLSSDINLSLSSTYSDGSGQDIQLSQTHNVLLSALQSAAFAESLGISQNSLLIFDSSFSSAFSDSITAQQEHSVLYDDSFSSAYADDSVIVQTQNLLFSTSYSEAFAESIAIALGNVINLSLLNAYSDSTASDILISSEHNVLLTNSESNALADDILILQEQLLNFADAISNSEAALIAISQDEIINLSLVNAYSDSNTDNINISQIHAIQLTGLVADSIADIITISQNHIVLFSRAEAQAIADSLALLGDGLGKIARPNAKIIQLIKSIRVIK